jgi:hypothetical protein
MKLKTFFLAFTLFFSVTVLAQECGSKLMPNYVTLRKQYQQLAAANPTLLPHDTCLNKKLSIVFYIFLDSLGNPNVTPAQLTSCITILNKYFKPICLEFMNCSTVYIPEHEYNDWDKPNHENKIVGNYNWFTEKTINIYLVANMVVPPKNGYAYGPGGRDLIVMRKSAFTGMTAVHEMGHFFGLPHTFAEISTNSEDGPSSELVNLSNCTTNGDGFCDTDADPYSTGSGTSPCGFVYGPKDANNQYYVPPVDNIMSYWSCRCRFTQEQYNWMAYMYITIRNYLH